MEHQDPNQIKAALEKVDHWQAKGLSKGLYSQSYAFILALWTGSIATLFILDSSLVLPLFVAGVLFHHFRKNQKGAWLREIQSRQDLVTTLLASLLVIFFVLGGFVLRRLEFPGSAIWAGLAVSGLMYAIMHDAYSTHWQQNKGSNE